MTDRALGPDRDIGGATADIDQADAEILLVVGEHRVGGSERLQHEVIDLQATAAYALDDVLRRRHRPGDDMHLRLEAEAAHADRLTDAVLVVDDEFLREDVQDLLVGRDRHRARGLDDAIDVHRRHFLVLDRDHAIRVETLDVAAGDSRIDLFHLGVGHQLDFLDHARNRRHRLLDVDDDALPQAA